MLYQPVSAGRVTEIIPGTVLFRTSTGVELRLENYCQLSILRGENRVRWGLSSRRPELKKDTEIFIHPSNPSYWTTESQSGKINPQ